MTVTVLDVIHREALAVFDFTDRYARDRGVGGPHPRPLSPVTVFLTDPGTPRFPVRLELVRNPTGYELFFGPVRTADGRRIRFEPPPRDCLITVHSPLYQTYETRLRLPIPGTALPIALEPGDAYPFPAASTVTGGGPTLLRGTVHRMDGGVAGAKVESAGAQQPVTVDDTGRWVLVFRDDRPTGPARVRVTFRGGRVVEAETPVERGRDNSLRQTALAGSVLRRGTPVPGAAVRVAGLAGHATTGPDGRWAFHFDPDFPAGPVDVTAELPGGQVSVPTTAEVRPRETAPGPTFRFD